MSGCHVATAGGLVFLAVLFVACQVVPASPLVVVCVPGTPLALPTCPAEIAVTVPPPTAVEAIAVTATPPAVVPSPQVITATPPAPPPTATPQPTCPPVPTCPAALVITATPRAGRTITPGPRAVPRVDP